MTYVFLFLFSVALCKLQHLTKLDKFVASTNFSVILFTRDNCTYCTAVEAEFLEAAQFLESGDPDAFPIDVAQIKNYPKLDHYPLIRLYAHGQFVEFKGNHTKQHIESWFNNRQLSHIHSTDYEASLRWVPEGSDNVLVAFNANHSDELYWIKMLKKDDLYITYSTLPNGKELLKVPEDVNLVLWTNRGQDVYFYEGEFNYKKVNQWVDKHIDLYYQEWSEKAVQEVFYEKPTKAVQFIFDDQSRYLYRNLSKIYQESIKTILIQSNSTQYDRLVDYLGIRGILQPISVILHENLKYRTQFNSEMELKNFINSFRNDKLQPYYKSQPSYQNEDWEKQVLNIVGSDFPKHEDIVILFYADWCKISQHVSTIFQDVFNKYKGQKAFGKFNADLNEAKIANLTSIPEVRLYRARDHQVISYDGPLDYDGLSGFVNQNLKRISGDL